MLFFSFSFFARHSQTESGKTKTTNQPTSIDVYRTNVGKRFPFRLYLHIVIVRVLFLFTVSIVCYVTSSIFFFSFQLARCWLCCCAMMQWWHGKKASRCLSKENIESEATIVTNCWWICKVFHVSAHHRRNSRCLFTTSLRRLNVCDCRARGKTSNHWIFFSISVYACLCVCLNVTISLAHLLFMFS